MSKVVSGKGRFSYLNWASAKKNELSGKDEYSTEFLIPKSDTKTITELKAAMKSALDKKFNGKYPANLRNPLRDGDTETKTDGSSLGEQYKGHYFIRCKSNEQPQTVDVNGNPILAANDFVSGDYGRVSITAYAYSQAGNNGVAFWLNNIQMLSKGDALGSKASALDDFGIAKHDWKTIPAQDNDIPFP
jgi:hypothetical protein